MRAKALLVGGALCAGLGAGPACAGARSADFYAGKTITLIVGTDVAGGFSIYSRLIADYLGKYIPGAPKIVVENMPGSGGNKAASWLYNRAPRDGLTIANLTPDSIMDRCSAGETRLKRPSSTTWPVPRRARGSASSLGTPRSRPLHRH